MSDHCNCDEPEIEFESVEVRISYSWFGECSYFDCMDGGCFSISPIDDVINFIRHPALSAEQGASELMALAPMLDTVLESEHAALQDTELE